MNRATYLVSALCVISFVLHAGDSSFLTFLTTQRSLEDFIQYSVPAADKNSFKEYYEGYNAKHKNLSAAQKNKLKQELQKKALIALDVKHHEWAQIIKQALQDSSAVVGYHAPEVQTGARIYLSRYGILEEYYAHRATDVGSAWSKIRDFAKGVSNKVANWAGSVRTKITGPKKETLQS